MYQRYKTIVTICARDGSKGLPNKNVLLLAGKPLIWHTINFAKKIKWVDRIVVSTDSPKIRELAVKFGVSAPFLRPKRLASDIAAKLPAILHAVGYAQNLWKEKYDITIDLAVTSPIRIQSDVENSVKLLLNPKTSTVVSGYAATENPYFSMVEMNRNGYVSLSKQIGYPLERRQDAPAVYTLNGSIYSAWTSSLFKDKTYFGKQTRIYLMPRERSFDLDSKLDFKFLEFYLKQKRSV